MSDVAVTWISQFLFQIGFGGHFVRFGLRQQPTGWYLIFLRIVRTGDLVVIPSQSASSLAGVVQPRKLPQPALLMGHEHGTTK